MSRRIICYGPFCYPKRIKHLKSSMQYHAHKHYCAKCWNYLKEQRFYRKSLYHYISRKAHVRFPTGMMLRDIGHLIHQRHYSYQGIKLALMYADKYSLKFKFNDNPYFVRYVPFVYDRAQRWNYDREKSDLTNAHEHVNNQIRSATVNPKVFDHSKKPFYHYDLDKF